MMKWGKKKPSPSSSFSSRIPSLSRVLPTAWLSTFKRMSINSEIKPAKGKPKEMRNSISVSSTKFADGGRERFYGGGDAADVFRRLSFAEDCADGKTSKSVSRSAWYDSDDELDSATLSYRRSGSNALKEKEKEDTKKFNDMACEVMMMKEFRRDRQILPDMKLKKTNERAMEERKLRRQSHDAKQKVVKSVEKNTLEQVPVRTIPMIQRENLKLTGDYQRQHQHLCTMTLRTSNLKTVKEDSAFTAEKLVETDVFSQEKLSTEWEKWEEMQIGKVKVKSEKQRKSVYMSRELPRRRMKQNRKVRVFSPRTASKFEICKIKALEDMKKAKLKMKAASQKTISGRTGLENFAVVKCSFEPEKDFRDSMIEMIREKRISQPEELEELLGYYLTLNSDAYHDLIIKVFQQVWLNLDQASSDTDLQNEQCSYN